MKIKGIFNIYRKGKEIILRPFIKGITSICVIKGTYDLGKLEGINMDPTINTPFYLSKIQQMGLYFMSTNLIENIYIIMHNLSVLFRVPIYIITGIVIFIILYSIVKMGKVLYKFGIETSSKEDMIIENNQKPELNSKFLESIILSKDKIIEIDSKLKENKRKNNRKNMENKLLMARIEKIEELNIKLENIKKELNERDIIMEDIPLEYLNLQIEEMYLQLNALKKIKTKELNDDNIILKSTKKNKN